MKGWLVVTVAMFGAIPAGAQEGEAQESEAQEGEAQQDKYGVGGGPQVHWGENLVLRVDTAYSPDANPIGFYLEAGRPF